jgi:hypothetical protein
MANTTGMNYIFSENDKMMSLKNKLKFVDGDKSKPEVSTFKIQN